MIAAIAAMLGVSGLTALLAYMVKPVLDDVFFAKQENMLYLLSLLVVVLYLVKGVLSYTHNYQMSYIGNATVTRLRDELFASIQRQPLSFFDGEATGVLMSRLTYDVNLLQDAVTRVVTSFFKDTFTVIGLSAVIFYREWRLALMAMVVFPLAVLIIVHLGKRIRRISHADPGGQRLSLHRAPGVPHRPAHRQGLCPGGLTKNSASSGPTGTISTSA